MHKTSLENIKEVLKAGIRDTDLEYEFLVRLLEIELLAEISDEEKIKTLDNYIDLEITKCLK